MSNSSPIGLRSGTDWGSLPAATRGLLLAVYFARAAGLLLLISSDAGWPARIGMAAVWLVPDALVFFGRPDLRGHLPGLLLFGFGLILGMVPGVLAELMAERIDATPAVAKGSFVAVGAAATAAILRLAGRCQAAGPSSPEAERGTAADGPVAPLSDGGAGGGSRR